LMVSALRPSACWSPGTAQRVSERDQPADLHAVSARVGRVHGDMDLNDVLPIPHQAAGVDCCGCLLAVEGAGLGNAPSGVRKIGRIGSIGYETPLPYSRQTCETSG
jgi:hypothetical protein